MLDPETIKAHLSDIEQGWLTRCEGGIEDWPSDDDEFVSFAEQTLRNLAAVRAKLEAVREQAQRHSEAHTLGSQYMAGMASAGRDILRILRSPKTGTTPE